MKSILENKKYIFWLCAPAMLLFGIFVLYPLINIFILSFQNNNGLSAPNFAGLANYIKIFTDESFNRANLASIGLCFLAIVFDAFLAVFVAVLLSTLHPTAQKLIRTAFLIPLVLSISVISQLWLTIYHAEWGLLNSFLEAIGLGNLTHSWLIDEKTAMICIAIVGMWWMFGMFVLLASSGIRSIPESCFEAARIDGATFFQTVRYITLPLMKGVTRTCVIIAATGGLYTFPQVFIMTGGGPGDLTQTIMMYMYRQAFANQRNGVAAAVGVVAIIETCVVIGLITWLFSEKRKRKDAE